MHRGTLAHKEGVVRSWRMSYKSIRLWLESLELHLGFRFVIFSLRLLTFLFFILIRSLKLQILSKIEIYKVV